MAGKTITQRIGLEGGAEIKAQLDQLGTAGEKAFGQIKAAADKTRGIGDSVASGTKSAQTQLDGLGRSATNAGQSLVNAFRAPPVAPFTRALSEGQLASARFGQSLRNFGQEGVNLGRNLATLNTPLGNFLTSLKSIAIVAVGLGAVKGLNDFFRKAGEDATETTHFAQSVGLTVDAYIKLRSAARQAGLEEEQFRRGLAKINEEFQSAAQNGADSSEVFKVLGKAGQDAGVNIVKGLTNGARATQTASQVFTEFQNSARDASQPVLVMGGNIAGLKDQTFTAAQAVSFLSDRIAGIQDPGRRAAAVVQILGARQAQWTEFLSKGSAEIANLTQKSGAFDSGAADRVAKLDAMNKSFLALNSTVKRLKEAFLSSLGPDVTALVTKIKDTITQNWDSIIKATKPLSDTIRGALQGAFKAITDNPDAVAGVFARISDSLSEIAKAAAIVFTGVSLAFNLVATALNPVAKVINSITGLINNLAGTSIPSVTGKTLAWTAEILLLVGGFKLFITGLGLLASGIKLFLSARLLQGLAAGFTAASVAARAFAVSVALPVVIGAAAPWLLFRAGQVGFKKTMEELKGIWNSFWSVDIPEGPKKAAAGIDSAVGDVGDKIRALATGITIDPTQAINGAEKITAAIGEATTKAEIVLNESGQSIVQFSSKIAEAAQQAGNDLVTTFQNTGLQLGGSFDETSSQITRAFARVGDGQVFEPLKRQATEASGQVEATFSETATALFSAFGQVVSDVGNSFVQDWSNLGTFVSGVVTDIGTFASQVATEFARSFSTANDSVEQSFQQLDDTVSQTFDSIVDDARDAGNAIQDALSNLDDVGGGGGPGFARGGFVRGPGTTTSDSVWARLSNNEWVMRAKAVKYYGINFMRMVNGLRIPRGFNMGGLVGGFESLMPSPRRYRDGGLVAAGPSGRPVVLDFGSKRFDVVADQKTAEGLTRYAIERQLHSAGRKPGYFAR